jgi:osmotically-inducible protein OsmY
MNKHYGGQEGRESQGQDRLQNGQRWNERYRDDDRGMRGARGGEYDGGWDQGDRRWASSGADFDREDYPSEDEYGSSPRGSFGSRGQARWSQRGPSSGGQGYGNQGSRGSRGFSGGHYGGFANEGAAGQGNYGGNRGFSNQGYSGQRFNQGWSGQGRDQSWGETFGQGYGGSEYGNQSFRGQSYGGGYQGRGFAGRGPKGFQRSDERVKEQLCERLTDHDDIDASEISLEVKNGEVTLTGTVNSRDEKRAAEEIAEQSPGVREVQNHLRVSHEASSSQGNQSGRAAQSQSKSRGTERE